MKKSYAQTAKQKEASVNAAATPGIAGQNAPKNPATPASSPANPWQKQPQIGTSVKVNEIKEVPAAVPLSSAVPSTPNTHGNGHKKVQNYNQPHQQQYYQYPQYPPEYNQYQYYYPPQQQQYNQQPAFQLPTPNKVKIKIVDPNSNQELKLPTPVKVTIKPATASAEKPVPVVKHPDTGEVIITPAKPVSIKPPTDTPSQVVNGSGASTLKNSPIVSKEDVLKPATAQIKSPVTKPAVPVTSEKVQAKVQDKTSIAIKPTVPKAVTLAEKVALGKSAVSSQKPAEPVKSTYAQPAKKPVEEVSPKAPIIISKPAVVSQPAGKPPAPTAVPAIQNSTSPLISVSPAKTSGPPGLTQSSEPVSEKYTVKKLSAESMPEIEDGQITEYLPEAPLLSTFDHIEYPNSVAKKPYVENGEIKYPVEFLMMFHETITAKPKEMMAWKDIYGDDANRQAPVRMSRQTSDRGRVRGQRGRGAGDRDRGSDRVDMSRQYSNSSRSGRGNLPPKGGRNRGPVAAIHVAPLVKGENAWDPKKMQLDESAAALKVIKGLLNKLTMDTFPKLSTKIIESNITNEDTLIGLITMISEKAIDEPHFASIYAMLCKKLFTDLASVHTWVCPDNSVQNNIFRSLLLKRCQEEFEKDAKWKAADDEAQIARAELRKKIDDLSAEEKAQFAEEDYQRGKLKRRVLGNMVFIGELYRQTLISEAVIHRCLKSLLAEIENPEEEVIESLCKLLTSAGRNLDHPKAEAMMNVYFERIALILDGATLTSRIRFLLMDVVDLRANKWIPKSGVIDKPKTIAQVHKEIQLEEKNKILAQRQGGKSIKKNARSQPQQSQHQDIRKIVQKEDGEWTATRQAWGSGGAKSRPVTATSTTEQTPTAKLSNAYGALESEQSPDKPAPVPTKSQSQIMEEAFKEYRESLEASEFLDDIQDVDEDEVIISMVKNIAQFLLDKNGRPALKVIFLLKKLFYSDEDSDSTSTTYSPDLLVAGFKQFFETFEDDRSDFPKGFLNISQVLNPLFAEKYLTIEQLLEISQPIAGYAGRKPVLPDFLADFLKASESPFKFIAETEFNIKLFFPDDENFAANVQSWSKMKSLDPSPLFTEVLTLLVKEFVFKGDFSNEAVDEPNEMKKVFELLQPSLINYKEQVLNNWNLDPVSVLVDTQTLLLEYNFTHYADSIFHILYGGDFFDRDAFLKFKNEHGAAELEDSLRKWEKKLDS